MNFKNAKKVLVDFDGTLADTSGCWIEAYRLLCLNKGISPPKEITELFGKISFDRWKCIVEIEIRKKCSFKDGDVLSCAKTVFSQRKPKQAVIDFLTMLLNCKKEIITMEPEELVIDWLNYHGITFFDKLSGGVCLRCFCWYQGFMFTRNMGEFILFPAPDYQTLPN